MKALTATFSADALAQAMSTVQVTECPAVTTRKQADALAKEAREQRMSEEQAEREQRAYELTEHNAENMRYDNEGVYYIGGKMVETRYGF
jgi:uncharacterized iron-regulated membrane protein